MVVEVGLSEVQSGKHEDQSCVEVRLDGQRVGVLTPTMSERYVPLVRQRLEAGERPACKAELGRDHRGVQVTLWAPSPWPT